jgi:4-amino-4-deoxy-L-arabinose transferase-like glycosyltransferase
MINEPLENQKIVQSWPSEMPAPKVVCPSSNWMQHLSILLPILLIYFVLAFYRIDHQSLWLDEIFSVRDSSSFALLWKKAQGPLHYILLHMWRHLGTSELAMRTLSVLLGAVAVCLFYATSMSLFTQRVTVLGTILFATSPFLIWYSQEVRYIILMIATALLAMYTLPRLNTRSRAGAWLVYGVTVILALLSFVTNIFLILAQGLYLLWSPAHRPLLRKWLVCLLLVSLPFGWWASRKFVSSLVRLVQIETTDSGEERLSIDPERLSRGTAAQEFTPVMIPYTFFAFSTGFSQGPSVRELHISQSPTLLLSHAPTLIGCGILFGGLFLVGLIAIWRHAEVGKFLTLWMCAPLAGVLVMTVITNLGYNVRYVAMIFPVYVLILAAGIGRFRRPWLQMILMVAVLGSNGLSLAHYYFDPQYAREDARAAAQYLEAAVQPQDVILAVGTTTPLKYYFKKDIPIVNLGSLHKMDRDMLANRLQEFSKEYDRLWLVEMRIWQQDPKGKVRAVLGDIYPLLEQKQLPGVSIYAYRLS